MSDITRYKTSVLAKRAVFLISNNITSRDTMVSDVAEQDKFISLANFAKKKITIKRN